MVLGATQKIFQNRLKIHPKVAKVPIFGYKKWHFGCLNENSETTFKTVGIAFGFKRFPLLEGF